jgi:hypothetical protein
MSQPKFIYLKNCQRGNKTWETITKPESKVLRRSKELRSKLGHMTLSEITTMLYDNIVYNKGR